MSVSTFCNTKLIKKFFYTFFLIFILFSQKTVHAESYEIISDWMDLFYRDDKFPWTLQKQDVSFLRAYLPDFVCKNDMSEEKERLMICVSRKGSYTGSYQITMNFGSKGSLLLESVEIAVIHPDLLAQNKQLRKWKQDAEELSDIIAQKDYISFTHKPVETTLSKDMFHLLMFKNAEYAKMFKFYGNVVTTGYTDGVLILNFSSEKYYQDHTYVVVRDENTGKEHRENIRIG